MEEGEHMGPPVCPLQCFQLMAASACVWSRASYGGAFGVGTTQEGSSREKKRSKGASCGPVCELRRATCGCWFR